MYTIKLVNATFFIWVYPSGQNDVERDKKYFHLLLDRLHLVVVVNVREGVQHVPEVLKIILNLFSVKNYVEMMYDMKEKIIFIYYLMDST